jgi:hypothetical protein
MLTEPTAKINLEELRSQLTGRVATLLICIGGLAMWMDLSNENFPTIVSGLWAGLLVVSLVAWRTNNRQPGLARHVLVWGLTAGLVAGMYLFTDAWIPFLGLPLGFISALLSPAANWSQWAVWPPWRGGIHVLRLALILLQSCSSHWWPG